MADYYVTTRETVTTTYLVRGADNRDDAVDEVNGRRPHYELDTTQSGTATTGTVVVACVARDEVDRSDDR